jgi:hypothetical protein
MTWPPIPDGDPSARIEFEKILYQGQVGEAAAQLRDKANAAGRDIAEDWELEKHNWELDTAATTAEYALQKSIHDARVEIAKDSIDRARKGAEFIRNAASAIATVYTGVAGLSFAVKSGIRLPSRGIIPAVFLGMALVFSSAYVAWLGRAQDTPAPTPHSSLPVYQERRLNAFVDWASSIALNRAYLLHSAVISLGAGVLFLPIAFIALPGWFVWGASVVSAVVSLTLPHWTAGAPLRRPERPRSARDDQISA